MSDEINEKELPEEGNSKGRLYPPVEKAEETRDEQDPQQATHGDAAAVRDGAPEPNDAE
jgi:hypothetical protein